MNDDVAVEISTEALEALIEDSIFLTALMGCGVDNWEGFEESQELYETSKEELLEREKRSLGILCPD